MNKNWSKVYSSTILHKAEIVKAILEDEEIDAVLLNKQISMYPTLDSSTEVEVYVANKDVIGAKHIIQKKNL